MCRSRLFIYRSNVQSLLVVIALTGYPLAACLSAALQIDNTPIAISVRAFAAALSLICLVIFVKSRFSYSLFYVLFLVFWCMYLARLYVDTFIWDLPLSKSDFIYWSIGVGSSLLPGWALLRVESSTVVAHSYRWLLYILSLCAVLASIFSSTESVGIHSYNSGRLALPAMNPISLGHMAATLLILSLWFFQLKNLPKNRVKTAFCIFVVFLSVYLIMASSSRGPVLGVLCAGVLFLSSRGFKRLAIGFFVLSIIGYIFLELAIHFQDLGQFSMLNRIDAVGSGNDRSAEGRFIAWRSAISQFADNPMFGSSLEEPITGFYPHNIILEGYMSVGILGGLILTFICLAGLIFSYQCVKRENEIGWVGLLYVQYFVGSLLSGAIWASSNFWVMCALVYAVYRTQARSYLAEGQRLQGRSIYSPSMVS